MDALSVASADGQIARGFVGERKVVSRRLEAGLELQRLPARVGRLRGIARESPRVTQIAQRVGRGDVERERLFELRSRGGPFTERLQHRAQRVMHSR